LAGWDPKDSTTVQDSFEPVELVSNFNLKNLTVGIPKEYHSPGLDEQIMKIWSDTATFLENQGAKVVPVSLMLNLYQHKESLNLFLRSLFLTHSTQLPVIQY
jgi:Asp-tRNA(Asn)/Glu-tRNA(Gln) amidotransferase A subunit family amidase